MVTLLIVAGGKESGYIQFYCERVGYVLRGYD